MNGRVFSPAETEIVRRGVEQGLRAIEMGRDLPGRPISSIANKMAAIRAATTDAPLAGEKARNDEIIRASAELRDRILALFTRTARERGCTYHEAARAALAHRPTTKGA